MRKFGCCIACLCLSACGPSPGAEDDTPVDGSSSTTRATSDSTSTGEGASSVGEDSTSGAPSGDSTGEASGDSTGVAVGDVTISGIVYDQYAPPRVPVPGVALYLDADPTVTTTTDADGQFVLSGVPAGEPAWIQVAPDRASAGTFHGVAVEGADVTGVELFRWDRDVADALEAQVVAMDPSVRFFPGTAYLVVVANLPQTTVALAPMPSPGSYYALDAAGAAVLDALTSDSASSPMVVFFNLGLHDAGDYAVTATHPSATCTSPLPSPPTSIAYVSFAHVTCR